MSRQGERVHGGRLQRLVSFRQLSHSARPTKTATAVPGAEEASLSPVETLLRVQWRQQVPAEAVQPGADCVGPGHLWNERSLAGGSQAWFK